MSAATARWYRAPVMWLVIGLLLLSCAGGIVMVGLAIFVPDQEVHSERLS